MTNGPGLSLSCCFVLFCFWSKTNAIFESLGHQYKSFFFFSACGLKFYNKKLKNPYLIAALNISMKSVVL